MVPCHRFIFQIQSASKHLITQSKQLPTMLISQCTCIHLHQKVNILFNIRDQSSSSLKAFEINFPSNRKPDTSFNTFCFHRCCWLTIHFLCSSLFHEVHKNDLLICYVERTAIIKLLCNFWYSVFPFDSMVDVALEIIIFQRISPEEQGNACWLSVMFHCFVENMKGNKNKPVACRNICNYILGFSFFSLLDRFFLLFAFIRTSNINFWVNILVQFWVIIDNSSTEVWQSIACSSLQGLSQSAF